MSKLTSLASYEKYTRRGRNYVVTEYETTDESGEVLMRGRETGFYVE